MEILFSKNKSLYIYAVFSVFVLGSFLFPFKKREMKKAIYISKTDLEPCLYTHAFFSEHAPYVPSVWNRAVLLKMVVLIFLKMGFDTP